MKRSTAFVIMVFSFCMAIICFVTAVEMQRSINAMSHHHVRVMRHH